MIRNTLENFKYFIILIVSTNYIFVHMLENKVFTDRMLLNQIRSNHKEIKHNLRYAQELHLLRNCKLKLSVFVHYLRSHKGISDNGAEDVNASSARNKV